MAASDGDSSDTATDAPPVAPLKRPAAALAVVALTALSAVLVYLRGRPTLNGDGGIFVSIAAAVGSGESLYTEVWDNKPPLFFYVAASASRIVGWRGTFLIDVLWLVIALVALWRIMRAVQATRPVAITTMAALPIVLTGAWYYAGFSELPGVALAFVLLALSIRQRVALGGVLLGALAFWRPDYVWLYLAIMLVPTLAGQRSLRRTMRATGPLLGGVAISAGVLSLVLLIRDELSGYGANLRDGLGYPGRALMARGVENPWIGSHLSVVWDHLSADAARAATAMGMLAVCTALSVGALARRQAVGTTVTLLASAFILTSIGALFTLASGALWNHNLQIIAVPGVVGLGLITAAAVRVPVPGSLRTIGLACIWVLAVIALGGLSGGFGDRGGSPQATMPLDIWTTPASTPTARALETVAARADVDSRDVTFARLGGNDDNGHLAFVGDRLRLVCPWFAQYVFHDTWRDLGDCLENRRPRLLVLTPFSFPPRNVATPDDVADEIRRIRGIVNGDYELVQTTRRDRYGRVEIWSRRGEPATDRP